MNPRFIRKDISNNLRSSAVYDPAGLIALWSGSLNTIPAGWKLCDGTGGTINTTNLFVYSDDSMESPGYTGGSTSHNHSYNTVPLHDHGETSTTNTRHSHVYSRGSTALGTAEGAYPGITISAVYSGADSALHSHSVQPTGGTGLYMSEEENFIPPYYEMAFIEKETNDPIIPIGLIVMWAGNIDSIPAGWELCNGSNGTPDLREKFIRGTPPGENPGTLGGSLTHNHTYTEIPTHTHTIAIGGASHNHLVAQTSAGFANWIAGQNVYASVSGYTLYADVPHTHDISEVGVENCTTQDTDNLPPYFKVAFIMNTVVSNALPLGVISMCGDSIANIPPGWNQCNGTNNTPNLLNRFLRGVANGEQPGIVGGSDNHSHIYTDVPLHTHTVLSDPMTHRHSMYVPRGYVPVIGSGWGVTFNWGSVGGYTSPNSATHNHDVLPFGSSTPYTANATSLPPYVKVIYIQKGLSLSNPTPENGATGISYNPILSVGVNDLEGDHLNVSFHNNASDDVIGTDFILGGTGTASVTWSGLSSGTSYSWYVKAYDGLVLIQSDTWSFTTNHAPDEPTNPSPSNGTVNVGENPTLSVDVSDNDGDDLTVSFYNASDDSLIDVDTVLGGTGTASVNWLGVSSNMICTWYVKVDDGLSTTQSSTWIFSTTEEIVIPPAIPLPDLLTVGLVVLGTTGIFSVIIYLRRKKRV